jgi:hypothetical protein
LFTIGVDVGFAVALSKLVLEVGGADSVRSGDGIIRGVVSPVMVEMEDPDGEEARK